MTRRVLTASIGAVVAAVAVVLAADVRGMQQVGSRVCLHNADETPEDAARRTDAVRLARAINTAQSAASSTQGRYVALEELDTLPPVPSGFEAALSTDGRAYAFSLKDTLDPCRFAYFSDQDGLIYVGAPLQ